MPQPHVTLCDTASGTPLGSGCWVWGCGPSVTSLGALALTLRGCSRPPPAPPSPGGPLPADGAMLSARRWSSSRPLSPSSRWCRPSTWKLRTASTCSTRATKASGIPLIPAGSGGGEGPCQAPTGRYPPSWPCRPWLLPKITPSSIGVRCTKPCSEQTTQSSRVSSFGPGSGTSCPAGRLGRGSQGAAGGAQMLQHPAQMLSCGPVGSPHPPLLAFSQGRTCWCRSPAPYPFLLPAAPRIRSPRGCLCQTGAAGIMPWHTQAPSPAFLPQPHNCPGSPLSLTLAPRCTSPGSSRTSSVS